MKCILIHMKVYCDNGIRPAWIKRLQVSNKVELMFFPYENTNRGIKKLAKPSTATWNNLNMAWNDLNDITWNTFVKSDKFEEIEKIIGKEHKNDIRHLDSAYKSKCIAFITSDKNDFINHRKNLEKLLDIRIFHQKDEREFRQLLTAQEKLNLI